MISRRSVDKSFLYTLPMTVVMNGVMWSFYFHFHNLINSLTVEQAYAVFQSKDFVLAWITLEYLYKTIMWPYLCYSFAFCGLAICWLVWSWALGNGFDSSSK